MALCPSWGAPPTLRTSVLLVSGHVPVFLYILFGYSATQRLNKRTNYQLSIRTNKAFWVRGQIYSTKRNQNSPVAYFKNASDKTTRRPENYTNVFFVGFLLFLSFFFFFSKLTQWLIIQFKCVTGNYTGSIHQKCPAREHNVCKQPVDKRDHGTENLRAWL